MPRAIHLTPRGVVTDDTELFERVKEYLGKTGVKYVEQHDGVWHKCYVSDIRGGDLVILMKNFAEQVGDVDVWLFMSKIYSSKKTGESGSEQGDRPP